MLRKPFVWLRHTHDVATQIKYKTRKCKTLQAIFELSYFLLGFLRFYTKRKRSSFPMTLSALLRMTGLEPARAQCPLEPESSASASSATSAHLSALDNNNAPDTFCQHFFTKIFKFLFYRKIGTRTGTTSVQITPLTKLSTATVALVFLLMIPSVVSMAVAPAGAIAQ